MHLVSRYHILETEVAQERSVADATSNICKICFAMFTSMNVLLSFRLVKFDPANKTCCSQLLKIGLVGNRSSSLVSNIIRISALSLVLSLKSYI